MTAFMDFVTSAGQEIFRDKVKVVPDFIKHKLHVDCSEEDYQAVLVLWYFFFTFWEMYLILH